MQRGLDLAAGIFRKPLIEQILKRNEVAQPALRILVLGDGYVAYLLLREYELEVIVHHHVFSPEAAEVFRDDTIDLTCIHVGHHAFERGSFEICSAPTVVNVLIHNM